MSLGVLLLVRESTGSFAAAGAAVGALGLCTALLTPFLGRRIDHRGPRRVLVSCVVQQAAALVLLALAAAVWEAPTWALVVLAGLAGARQPPIAACARVLWPTVARSAAARDTAYTLDATAQDVVWVVGPLVVSVLVTVASPTAAVMVMPVIAVVGTAWFVQGPTLRAWPKELAGGTKGQALRARGVRVVIITALVTGLGMGAVEVGLPGLAAELGDADSAGKLLAVSALSSVLGGVAFGLRRWRTPVERRLSLLLGACVLLIGPLALAGSPGIALGLSMISGLAWAPALACVYALIERLAPARASTEAFAWASAAVGGGIALGSAAAGWLVQHHGSPAAFAFSAAVSAVACVAVTTGSGRLRR